MWKILDESREQKKGEERDGAEKQRVSDLATGRYKSLESLAHAPSKKEEEEGRR